MSHIVDDIRPSGFKKGSFILLGIAVAVLVVSLLFGDDIAKAVTEFINKEVTAATLAKETARPKDYTELSLGDEHLKEFKFELKGANRSTGLLILDQRATNLRFCVSPKPGPGLDFIECTSGTRTPLPPGDHSGNDPFHLWEKLTHNGRKQFFSVEAKGDCTVIFTVSVR